MSNIGSDEHVAWIGASGNRALASNVPSPFPWKTSTVTKLRRGIHTAEARRHDVRVAVTVNTAARAAAAMPSGMGCALASDENGSFAGLAGVPHCEVLASCSCSASVSVSASASSNALTKFTSL